MTRAHVRAYLSQNPASLWPEIVEECRPSIGEEALDGLSFDGIAVYLSAPTQSQTDLINTIYTDAFREPGSVVCRQSRMCGRLRALDSPPLASPEHLLGGADPWHDSESPMGACRTWPRDHGLGAPRVMLRSG